MRQNLTLDGALLTMENMDDWHEFVAHNWDAIVDDYGSVDNAYKHAIDGGLRFGGGAMPITDVCFEM